MVFPTYPTLYFIHLGAKSTSPRGSKRYPVCGSFSPKIVYKVRCEQGGTFNRYSQIEDDLVSKRMLQDIIDESASRGDEVMAEGGIEGTEMILKSKPDVVLIDLLMPDQDGIETIIQLKDHGFNGKFIMISQIENKDMVGEAYQNGIEFFIHKPINRVEVEHVLNKVNDQWKYERYVSEIKQSLAKLNIVESSSVRKERKVRDVVKTILMDLGIIGEIGSKDIIALMENAIEHRKPLVSLL